ncbi:MAG: hypothetical protein GXP39_02750 [Chloroflexi bacterium]|nr:hypothetical protein [Chloroflexota bacterium]
MIVDSYPLRDGVGDMRVLFRPGTGGLIDDLPSEQFRPALRDPRALLWVDLDASEDGARARKLLRDVFHFHPLTVEDALGGIDHPRLNDFGEYLFLVVCAVDDGETADPGGLAIFLGPNYLITCHMGMPSAVRTLLSRAREDEGILAGGAARLLCELLRDVASGFAARIEQIERDLERVEAAALGRPSPEVVRRAATIRGAIARWRPVLASQRDVVGGLIDEDHIVIPSGALPHLRDLLAHLGELVASVAYLHDRADGVMDLCLAVAAGRLAVWGSVWMVFSGVMLLSLLAAVMYAGGVPWGWRYGLLLGGPALVGVGYIVWRTRRQRDPRW